MLLSAALVTLIQPPATQINNSSTQEKAKAQAVQAEESRKAPTLVKEEEKALTDQPVVDEPETVVATTEPVKVQQPAPQQGCDEYRSLVEKYDWDTRLALAVMEAESSCNPDAVNLNSNASSDRGLFQINSVHLSKVAYAGQLFDPATNIQVAYAVYKGSGWQAWSSFKSGKHLKFL